MDDPYKGMNFGAAWFCQTVCRVVWKCDQNLAEALLAVSGRYCGEEFCAEVLGRSSSKSGNMSTGLQYRFPPAIIVVSTFVRLYVKFSALHRLHISFKPACFTKVRCTMNHDLTTERQACLLHETNLGWPEFRLVLLVKLETDVANKSNRF